MCAARNPGATAITIFGTGLGGLMYGVAFLGGRNIWLPVGLHFGWNFFQGNIFGFPVSGTIEQSLIVQETVGADLWTGGAYGPEAGLIGMASRFVVIALLLMYLHWRSHLPSARLCCRNRNALTACCTGNHRELSVLCSLQGPMSYTTCDRRDRLRNRWRL